MRKLIPTHVVFNGKVGALTGKNALTAKVGETVLIVHSQANRETRPHLIGGHGDYVWETGKFANPPETDLETWGHGHKRFACRDRFVGTQACGRDPRRFARALVHGAAPVGRSRWSGRNSRPG
jgi:hypothetical protein